MKQLVKLASNPKIFVFTVIWLMVLVFFGTLAQRDVGLYASQQKYFSSYFFWIFNILPVPGGRITMLVMFTNLISMLFKRNIWKFKKSGIVIVHLGAVLLLVGGGVTAGFSSEGNMTIDENKRSSHVDDYHIMELAVMKIERDSLRYTVFDQPLLKEGQLISHESLDFKIEVIDYFPNCSFQERITPPGIDYKGFLKNFVLFEKKSEKENTQNRPAIIFLIKDASVEIDGIYGLFLGQRIEQALSIKGTDHVIEIRRKRTHLPFTIELLDFKKVLHPGTDIPQSFSSEINLIENDIPRRVLIQMNEPLRYKGYTFFQASFIEGLEGESTVLAVVKNYGRLFPYISSIVMCAGLLIHLLISVPKLIKKNTGNLAQ